MGKSKKATVGYKYYLGMQMVVCHGPIDSITRISVDKRVAWVGNSSGGNLTINKPGLFGGESKEGGISGDLEVLMGKPTQSKNSYLQARLGVDIPAFRGVVSLVLKQMYLSMNPYLKPWSFRGQRLYVKSLGEGQWYPGKVSIVSPSVVDISFFDDFTNGLGQYSEYNFPGGNDPVNIGYYSTSGSILTISGMETPYVTHPSIYRALSSPAPLQQVSFKVRLNSIGDDDNGGLNCRGAGFAIVAGFGACRDSSVDSLRRPTVSFKDLSGDPGSPIGPGPLPIGIWHNVIMEYNPNLSLFYCEIRRLDNNELFGSVSVTLSNRIDIETVHFENDNSTGNVSGSSSYDDVYVLAGEAHLDMNPSHIIRECLTDPIWGMGYLTADVDDDSFAAAADVLYNEGMGISLIWDSQMAIEEFINEIIRHIDATLYVDRVTGKFTLKLIRGNYNEDNLITLGTSNIQKVGEYNRINPGNAVNSVTVTYWDKDTGENDTVTADDIALIQSYGTVINTSLQYPGFTNSTLAGRAALRDLKSLSFPLLTVTIESNRAASELNIGDPFKFEWPDYHDGYIIMRVNQISFGDGKRNRIKIVATEDVFALPNTAISAVEESGFEEAGGAPLPPSLQLAFEAPYYELMQFLGQTQLDNILNETPDVGYLQFAATRPENGINAEVMVDSGGGYNSGASLDFSPTGILLQAVSKSKTAWKLENFEDLDQVTVGSHGQCGNELFRVDAINSSTGLITVGRAVLDTIPEEHTVGSSVIFWDNYSATDAIEYVDGETVQVKILTNSAQGQLDVASGVVSSATMNQRPFRPYRPAGLALEGDIDPSLASYPNYPVTLSWVHRNRIQETSGTLLDWTDAGITPEPNTAYKITIEALDGNKQFVELITTVTQAGTSYSLTDTTIGTSAEYPYIKFIVETLRDGTVLSRTAPYLIFRGPFQPPSNLNAQYKAPKAPQDITFIQIQ